MKKTCAACGGELFQFTPPPSIRGVSTPLLPTACRRCGQICIEGTPLSFPESFERRVAGIAEEAAHQGQLAREQLVTDPNVRVEKYFDHVYRTGFVHGFMRALAWFSHQVKEGRLKRLRRLWRDAERSRTEGGVEIRMSAAAVTEFDHLMEMDVLPRGEHGPGLPNAHRAG
jgi:hypothetical protein